MLGSTFVPLLLIRLHNTASTAAIFRLLCYRRHTKELKRVGEEREREKQRRCFRGQWHRRLLYSQHRVENTAVSVAEITVHEILTLRFQMSHVVCCATYKEKNISAKCIKKKKKSKAHVVAQPIPKVSVSSLRLINITRHWYLWYPAKTLCQASTAAAVSLRLADFRFAFNKWNACLAGFKIRRFGRFENFPLFSPHPD